MDQRTSRKDALKVYREVSLLISFAWVLLDDCHQRVELFYFSSTLKRTGSQSLFVPNGLLGISGTTATANEEVQAQVPSTSMLIERPNPLLAAYLLRFHSIQRSFFY